MQPDVIYTSEYIRITKIGNDYYVESFKKGLNINAFNLILEDYKDIVATNFIAVKNALMNAPVATQKFGEMKQRITIHVSNDNMHAHMVLNVPEQELDIAQNKILIDEIRALMTSIGIVYGSKLNEYTQEKYLVNKKSLVIAEGLNPIEGQSSIVKMIDMNAKEEIYEENGSVNYFELSLVKKTLEGEWLGEWTEPTKGIDGMDIKGHVISSVPGKSIPILYDKVTIKEEKEKGVTRLLALSAGAIEIKDGKLTISSHLDISGDVDFKTGNIHFDGSVTIKGTVQDSFSVIATKDIEILGKDGVGCVREIVSTHGSIMIAGGLNGRHKSVIKANKDVILKFVSEATVISGRRVRIGAYALNSDITTKELIVEGSSGCIMGGRVEVISKIECSYLGSVSEQLTLVVVKGFNKNTLKKELEQNLKSIESTKYNIVKLEKEIMKYKDKKEISSEEQAKLGKLKKEYINLKNEKKNLEEQKMDINKDLGLPGEGNAIVGKKIYPRVVLTIKGVQMIFREVTSGGTYYFQDQDIKLKG